MVAEPMVEDDGEASVRASGAVRRSAQNRLLRGSGSMSVVAETMSLAARVLVGR